MHEGLCGRIDVAYVGAGCGRNRMGARLSIFSSLRVVNQVLARILTKDLIQLGSAVIVITCICFQTNKVSISYISRL